MNREEAKKKYVGECLVDTVQRDAAFDAGWEAALKAESLSGLKTVRPFVEKLAYAMERKLRENDHKQGGFEDLSEILSKLMLEVHELSVLIINGGDSDSVRREAADVCNYAGMCAAWYSEDALPSWNKK